MNCPGIDAHNPFVWAFVAGFFLGAAIAESTINPKYQRNPERIRTWKWVWACIFASCFVGAGAAGLFLSDPGEFISLRVLFFGGGAAAVCGTGFRFWKVAGIPLIMLLLGLSIYMSLVLAPFDCLRESRQIGWFRVFSEHPEETRAELNLGGDTAFIELDGKEVHLRVATVSVPRYFVICGGNVYYRALSPAAAEQQKEGQQAELRRAERLARRLPGIRFQFHETEAFAPNLFQKYDITLHPGGKIELEEEY
jgi:hypothetical protein